MDDGEQVLQRASRRRGMSVCRMVLWGLFVVLGAACLWIWWVMGELQKAMDKQSQKAQETPAAKVEQIP